MAGQAQPIGITTAFPAPPPFYKFFTPENLERQKEYLESLKQSSSDPSAATPILPDLFSLPPELRNLIPPPLPPDGKYRLFGQELEISSDLSTTALPTPTPSRLQALTQSLLLSFLSLTHALATNPNTFGPIWDEMKAAFEEIHQVINGYRPHQARETLILMMEEQIAQVKTETWAVKDSMRNARELLETLAENDRVVQQVRNGDGDGGSEEDGLSKKKRREKAVWEMIEREVGKV